MSDWTDWMPGLILAVVLAGAFGFGWIAAHEEVKTECERQGSFYVGNKTFTCEAKP